MTITRSRRKELLGRLGVLILLAAAMFLFSLGPPLMRLDAYGTEQWYVAGWIVAPFLAGLLSFRAAGRLGDRDRKAWRNLGFGCFSWMVAIVIWAGYGWFGTVLRFPSVADFFFLLSGGHFAIATFQYSVADAQRSRMQVTNFSLAICATVATGLLLYFPVLIESQLGWFGALVAFAYPAMGLSTLVFGLICYFLYVRSSRSFIFRLIVTGLGAIAVSNYFYGLDVLNETYSAGTLYDVVWIAGFVFIAWAALEQRQTSEAADAPTGQATGARSGQALVPALSTAAVLFAVVFHLSEMIGYSVLALLPFILGFVALLAIREHSLITAEQNLRADAEGTAQRLAKSEAQLARVLEITTDGVLVLDRDFRVNFANNNAISMMFPDRPYLGIPLWIVIGSSPTSEVYANYRKSLEQQLPLSFESYFAPMGMWLEDHVFPSPDTLTVFFRDVTERRSRREELVRLSQHDPLTGLANRSLFDERLALGLQCGRRHSDLILVMIDFDDFKAINDNLGHMAGDRLVQQFAQRISGLMRLGDTVARFGGDEFAIIQPGLVEPNAGAEVARRIAEALLTPFDLGGSEVKLAVSIGIAMAPKHGVRPDELVRRADLAMYCAKEGKGTGVNYRVFEPAMEDARQSPRRGPPPWP